MKRTYEDENGAAQIAKGLTEVVSVGIEYLARFPEILARQNPKHFDRIVECLRMCSAR